MRKNGIYVLLLFLVLGFVACNDDDTPNHGLEANAGSNQTVQVGERVDLSSNATVDRNATGYESNWTFVSRPEGSEAMIANAGAASASFVPDVVGDYHVRLTVSNNLGESSTEVVITATLPETVEIGGTHNENLHLVKLGAAQGVPDYIVSSSLTINARLTIDPGVRIEVGSDNLIRINSNGSVVANGTEQDPVIITGTSQLPGYWRGIWLLSNNIENELNHVHVSHAGSGNIASGAPRAGLHMGTARLTINNSRFTDIDGFGVSVSGNASQVPLNDCWFENNSLGAMQIEASQIRDIDNGTDFNGQDIVISGSSLNVNADHVWRAAQNGVYRFSSTFSIDDNVTIEAGAQFVAGNDVLVRFRSGSEVRMQGTEQNPIVFSGTVEQAGAWRGMLIENSSLNNRLEHVHFRHAGHSNLLSGFQRAALGFGNNARGTLNNVHFSHINGYGVFIRYDGTRVVFEQLNFGEGITQGAAYILTSHISDIDTGSDFGNNYVVVDGGTLAENEQVEWNPLQNGKYLFTSGSSIWGKATILPGTIMGFYNDVLLRVRVNGVIVAQGTASENIVFTRREGSVAHWRGITIESGSVENLLEYVEISYGGNANLLSGLGTANLGLANNSRLTLRNSTISHSLGYGVFLHNTAQLTEDANNYSGNASGNSNQD